MVKFMSDIPERYVVQIEIQVEYHVDDVSSGGIKELLKLAWEEGQVQVRIWDKVDKVTLDYEG
jgi:hypothetical protein